MKKTAKQIKQEVDETEKELLEDIKIDEDAKQTIKDFRDFCKEFPEKVDELMKYVKGE